MLVGPMAAGKSSVGRRLATLMGWPFIDTDAEISRTHGSPSEIFAREGESTFRRLEEDTIRRALDSETPSVISLGGGAVLSEVTRDRIRPCTVVFLNTDSETVLSRANLEKRPLLKDDPSAWERIYRERLPLYEDLADVTFDTRKLPKDEIARRVRRWLSDQEKV